MGEVSRILMSELCDFLFACEEDHLFDSNDPAPSECPLCAKIKAAEDKRGEEVLKLGCKDNCLHCQAGHPVFPPQEGDDPARDRWWHKTGDGRIMFCHSHRFRQAYKEKFGDG